MTEKEFFLQHRDKETQDWYRTRPASVKKAILSCPPDECYRGKDGKGHYILRSYVERKGEPTRLTMVHGRDSFWPGTIVFGMPPEDLKICGCGKWRPPTKQQIAATKGDRPK